MNSRFVTVCFILYLFLLAPFGRTVQAWVEKFVSAEGAVALTMICLGFVSMKGAKRFSLDDSLIRLMATALLCLVISQFILYPVEWSHIVHYALLAALLKFSFRLSGLWAAVAASGIGIIDESLQGLTPTRVFDFRDLALNVVGSGVGICIQGISRESLRSFRRRSVSYLGV